MDIGRTIKEHRKKRGLTQRQLGLVVNQSESWISHYETNNRIPSGKRLICIMAELDLHYNDFLTHGAT